MSRSGTNMQAVRRFAIILAAASILFTLVPLAQAEAYWYENYQKAVDLIDRGQWKEASKLLEQIVKDHPVPVKGLRIPGNQFIDYTPYYQRARIALMRGDSRAALANLDYSIAFREAEGNPRFLDACKDLRSRARAASGGAGTPRNGSGG